MLAAAAAALLIANTSLPTAAQDVTSDLVPGAVVNAIATSIRETSGAELLRSSLVTARVWKTGDTYVVSLDVADAPSRVYSVRGEKAAPTQIPARQPAQTLDSKALDALYYGMAYYDAHVNLDAQAVAERKSGTYLTDYVERSSGTLINVSFPKQSKAGTLSYGCGFDRTYLIDNATHAVREEKPAPCEQ